jgi:hypothetical protein
VSGDPFDLAQIGTVRADEGVPLVVIHPVQRRPILLDNGEPVTVTLLGRSSEAFRDVLRSIQLRRAGVAKRGETLTDDDLFREDTDTLAACTVTWTIPTLDGQPFPFNQRNNRKLWNDARFRWLRDRALAFLMEDANFLPLASLNSKDTPDTTSVSTSPSPAAEA